MKQLDIFGNEIDIKTINAEVKKQRSGRLSIKDTFRKLHGYNKGNYCKNCHFCICNTYRNRKYYKCYNLGLSNSEATDIRLKDYACDLFKRKENT
ncbi:hypothetical protein [Thomasclavelia cocleata]|uniref:hypothetical protein n=1 Tax=Thomasclavelia cocleata TaxID=69824 RepID=UPI00242A537A|nr:hypothetical protein [Thomasclavelia cocleata]